jgi:hypothetical protein
METYIIRIYRWSPGGAEPIVGIAEHVETGEKIRFINYQELNGILTRPQSTPAQDDTGRGGKGSDRPSSS